MSARILRAMAGGGDDARAARLWFGAWVVLFLLAVTWPGHALVGGRIEPFVLGLPFALAWTVGWVLATFGALVLFHRAHERR